MGVYTRQQQQATKKIKQKGKLCLWTKHTVTTDGSKPWNTTPVAPPPTPIPVYIVFLKPKQDVTKELIHLVQGTSIPEGGPYGLMAGVQTFTPEVADSVLVGIETLVVKSIDVVAPNVDEPILWK